MSNPFQPVQEVGYAPPSGCEDWLFAASFAPLLPDRFNAWFLFRETNMAFPDKCALVPDEPELDVVVSVEFIIAPDDAVAAFVAEKLQIIEDGGILDEAAFWAVVNPIIQKLWEGESATGRQDLCRQVAIDGAQALEPDVPEPIRDLLYRQISM